jgi:hypothetical protein
MRHFKTSSVILVAGVGMIAATSTEQVPASTRSDDPVRMVTLESYGVAELTPEGGEPVEAVHVRATITNTGLRPLVVDTSKARAEIVKGITVGPRFVNSNAATLPIAIIDRGERQTLDFYFAVSNTRDVSSFEFAWPLNVPHATAHAGFTRNTERARIGADTYTNLGHAATWWFDPQFAWSTYFHHPGTAKPRPPRFVTIDRQPTWELPVASDDITHDCDEW